MGLKEKILEAAYELFSEKGYDNTSVADIIHLAGASKGGFYHHYKSKEEILETISLSYIANVKVYHDEILVDKDMSLPEKFIASFYRVGEIKKESLKQWPKIKKIYDFKGNHILLKKMGDAFQNETKSFYFNLINQGNKKGVFKVSYPSQLAALWSREVIEFHRVSRRIFSGMDKDKESFYDLLSFNEELINHQLGLEKDRISLLDFGRKYLESMEAEYKSKVTD
jgi:hypothetical protein